MATLFLVNIPILPKESAKTNSTHRTTSSPQNSICEEYFTPRPSIRSSKTPSDSDSTFTDHSLTDDTDNDDFVSVSNKKSVRFNVRSSKAEIQLKLENDEAEFFAYIPPEEGSTENIHQSLRKRDRIRSAFRKKLHRSPSNSSDASSTEWNEVLAKTLMSMHDDIQDIMAGFDQIDQPLNDEAQSNTEEPVLTKPRLSFRERQREKVEMMRIAQMLNPPNLLTYDPKESPYAYTDIIQPNNFNLLRLNKGIPDENLLIQHKPFRHRKFLYRTQRGLLRMKHDLKKLRHDVYGESSTKTQQEASSLDVLNYRYRLEKTLLDVRKQIAEYDRVHASTDDHRPSIREIIANMDTIDSKTKVQIEDYRMKSRPMERTSKRNQHELISAPYIPLRARNDQANSNKKNDTDHLIDTRFDPKTFLDLTKEATIHFGSAKPFWDQPPERRLSVALPLEREEPVHFTLPSKVGIWDRFLISFKTKQKLLRKVQMTQHRRSNNDLLNQINENNEQFFDCSSRLFQRRRSRSFDASNTVDF